MKVLVLDNYDSFTYNLVHILRHLDIDLSIEVHRNDKIDLVTVGEFDKILLSPGPGVPADAGIMPILIKKYASTKSILGICLGHQAIGEAFGGELYNMTEVLHGIATDAFVVDKDEQIFNDLPSKFSVCRYHSWAIVETKIPKSLVVTAQDEKQRILGVRHRNYNVSGLQFHPESILTEHGITMMKNWIYK